MKIYRFDGMDIRIRERESAQEKISARTPQINFLQSHKADVEREIGAIRAMCSWIARRLDLVPVRVWDLMAGCGFSSRIFLKDLKCLSIVANDLSEVCAKILCENFPTRMRVINENIFDLPFDELPRPGLVFIDFNTFTVLHIKDWHQMLQKVFRFPCPVALVDSASFGFRFGNLEKYYQLERPIQYYRLLDSCIRAEYDRRVCAVFPFGPAAIVLTLPEAKRGGRIYAVESAPIPIHVTQIPDKGGFNLI